MKSVILLSFVVLFISCSTHRNNLSVNQSPSLNTIQKVDLYSLRVKNDSKEIDIKSIIIGEDFTYLSDLYSANQTRFYNGNNLFSGIGIVENDNQITRITFKNGILEGAWYDQIIWNGNLTTTGNFVNGLKDGEWKNYFDGNLTGTEIYIMGTLKN